MSQAEIIVRCLLESDEETTVRDSLKGQPPTERLRKLAQKWKVDLSGMDFNEASDAVKKAMSGKFRSRSSGT